MNIAHNVVLKQLEDGHWICTVPDFPGVWSDGDSPEGALVDLADVIRDWFQLKAQDADLPVLDVTYNGLFQGPVLGVDNE